MPTLKVTTGKVQMNRREGPGNPKFSPPPRETAFAEPKDAPAVAQSLYPAAAVVAFDHLFPRAFELATRAAKLRGMAADDAEDVASLALDGLLDAVRNGTLPPEPAEDVLVAWIEPRVFHRRLDWLRAMKRERERRDRFFAEGPGEADPKTITTQPDLARLELRDAVVRAVRGMTPTQQQVAMLVREGKSPDEIAGSLGIAYASARQNVWRVTKLLRDALGPQYEAAYAKRLDWYGEKRRKREMGGQR